MRDIFVIQSIRQFVHEFIFFEFIMKFWIFDRFDFYNSEVFDIYKKFEQFIKTIAKYTLINDEKFDVNIFTNLNEKYRFIIIIENTIDKKKLRLKKNSIIYQQTIVCRGTFCFRVKILSFKKLQYVVKFFWIFDKRRSKIDFFNLTREKKMKKIVKLFDYYRIINIANMREKLNFEKFYVFRNIVLNSAFFFRSFNFFFNHLISVLI